MSANNFTYEIIFVNDGSTDGSWDVIERLSKDDANVRGIKFRRNYGKSRHSSAASRQQRAMSSSLWTQTCRIRLTRFRNSTE